MAGSLLLRHLTTPDAPVLGDTKINSDRDLAPLHPVRVLLDRLSGAPLTGRHRHLSVAKVRRNTSRKETEESWYLKEDQGQHMED